MSSRIGPHDTRLPGTGVNETPTRDEILTHFLYGSHSGQNDQTTARAEVSRSGRSRWTEGSGVSVDGRISVRRRT